MGAVSCFFPVLLSTAAAVRGVDPVLLRVARSFYLVKMARYAALLLVLSAVVGLAVAADAPRAVVVVVGVLAVSILLGAVRARRRYLNALRRPVAPPASSSPSPRA